MAAVHRSALAFVVERGHPVEAAARLRLIDPLPEDDWGLILAVQPLPGIDRDVFQLALDEVSRVWSLREGASVQDDLMRGFAAAHHALNAVRHERGLRSGESGMVGMTALAYAGAEAVLVQSLPGRVIIAGPGGVQTSPAWPAWDPAAAVPAGTALGGERARRPHVEQIDLGFGDVLVVCDSGIGNLIWRREEEGKPFRGLLTALTPDSTLDQLLGVAAGSALDDAFGLVLPIGPACDLRDLAADRDIHEPRSARRFPWSRSRRDGDGVAPFTSPAAAAVRFPAGPTVLEHARMRVVEAVESRAGAMLPGSAPEPPIAPWVRSVSRYNTPPDGYPDWRGRLPMLDGLGGGARTLGFAVLAGALLGGAGFGMSIRQERTERAAAAVVLAQEAIGSAAANPAQAGEAFISAESALAAARRNGADLSAIRQLEGSLEATRDRAWGVERLDGMRRAGSIPAAIATSPVTLLATSSKAYLVGHGLYEIDAASGQLIQVLTPGQDIGGSPLAPLVGGVADRTSVIVTDGAALYRQDDEGVWQRLPLGPGGNPLIGRPVAAFNGMLYTVSPEGSILRYRLDADGARSETWAGVGRYPDLASARQLAVNERIHVLLTDGTVDTFYEGALESVTAPLVTPPPAGPTFLAGAGDSGAIYLVDPQTTLGSTTGRILGFLPGGAARQFAAPIPGGLGGEVRLAATVIAEASQVVVVEQTGEVLLLNGKDLWVAKAPAAPSV
jgi:hypothetical protein